METERAAKTYHKLKNRFFIIGLALDVVVLIFLSVSGLSAALKNFSVTVSSQTLIINGIYISLFYFGMYLIHLPLNIFVDFKWEHKFGLSNQTFWQWLNDNLKKTAISFVFTLLVVEVIYVLLGRFPQTWWIGAGTFWLFLTLVLARITPNVLIPLFYQYSDLEDQDLKQRILDLFEKCQVKIENVYAINFSAKTKKANAFICGLGKSRRVVLSDTLLSNFSNPEIETVVAHELGHYKNRDILRLTLINAVTVFLGFFLIHKLFQNYGTIKIDDIAAFPVLALVFSIFAFAALPFLNWYSRILEVGADRFSLAVTDKKKEFISMMKKLGEMNLAEFKPGLMTEIFFYDHPPIEKRIEFARHFNPAAVEKG